MVKALLSMGSNVPSSANRIVVSFVPGFTVLLPSVDMHCRSHQQLEIPCTINTHKKPGKRFPGFFCCDSALHGFLIEKLLGSVAHKGICCKANDYCDNAVGLPVDRSRTAKGTNHITAGSTPGPARHRKRQTDFTPPPPFSPLATYCLVACPLKMKRPCPSGHSRNTC